MDLMINFLLILILLSTAGAIFFMIYFLLKLFQTSVPYVPTGGMVALKMIELANLKPGARVYDLGCGDGKIIFLADKLGARATGFELIRPLVWFARVKNFFRHGSAEFRCEDFFGADLGDADVVFCYLFPSVMDRIFHEKFSQLRQGTKIISHAFPILQQKPLEVVMIGKAKIWIYEKN